MADVVVNSRYTLVRALSSDGRVCLTLDRANAGCHRVLKFVDSAHQQQVTDEFAVLCELHHPNVVAVYELDRTDQELPFAPMASLFFTCEFIDGLTPSAHLATLEAATRAQHLFAIARDLSAALAHVHSAGVIHRDIKPSNVVVRDGGDGDCEAILLDLGLSSARGQDIARGTVSYMSPEALAGHASIASDLYSLGATLYELVSGAPPFSGVNAGAVARSILSEPAPALSEPSLPQTLIDLINQLLAPDPSDRPSSAQAVRDELQRIRTVFGFTRRTKSPPRRSPHLIGRIPETKSVETVFTNLAAGAEHPQLIRIVAAAGLGKRALVASAIRNHQLRAARGQTRRIRFVRGNAETIASLLGSESPSAWQSDAGFAAHAYADQVLELLRRCVTLEPVVVVCAVGNDERLDALVSAMGSGAAPQGAVAIALYTVPSDRTFPVATCDLVLDGLAEMDVHALATCICDHEPPLAWSRQLARATHGIPAMIIEATRLAYERTAGNVGSADVGELLHGVSGFADLAVRRATHLPQRQVELLEAIAVDGGRAPRELVKAMLNRDPNSEATLLADVGLVFRDDQWYSLPSAAHARAIARALPRVRRNALHRAALAWHKRQPNPSVCAIADHLAIVGPKREAMSACTHAARTLGQQGRARQALQYARRAIDHSKGASTSAAHLHLAQLATQFARYELALTHAQTATRARDTTVKYQALLCHARALQKTGALAQADSLLSRLITDDPEAWAARGYLARIRCSQAQYRDAIAVAALQQPQNESLRLRKIPQTHINGFLMRYEAAALAHLHLGHIDRAREQLANLEHVMESTKSAAPHRSARLLGLRGMLEQADGDIDAAAATYARATELAKSVSDVHGAAVYAANQSSAESERGRFARALVAIDEAIVALERLGNVAEFAPAVYNRGILCVLLGDIEGATHAAARVVRAAEVLDRPTLHARGALLHGDIAMRTGKVSQARACYTRASELAQTAGDRHETTLALIGLAEALAITGDERALKSIEQAIDHSNTEDDSDRLTIAHAKVSLALGLSPPDVPGLEAVSHRLHESNRKDQAWRCDLILARAHRAAGAERLARTAFARAQTSWDEIVSHAPEVRQRGLRSDPDAVGLRAFADDIAPKLSSGPTPDTGQREQLNESRFRRLLLVSRQLNSELRLRPLLDSVIDTAVELSSAERGFLLLRPSSVPGRNDLEVIVARHFHGSELSSEDNKLSRSIADRVVQTGEVVVTVDASFDERFGASESIAALRLRSVLAVPLREQNRIIGAIYLDHRFQTGAFGNDAVEVTLELANTAAVAIRNARLTERNQERERQIAALNRRLEQAVEDTEARLLSARAQLKAGHDLGPAYDSIVGRSQPMTDLLQLVDRAAATDFPVVISGESGTGKELIARALHEAGKRKRHAFVAINCGAVPESLLESELFGHVRGAFTGADRDRRGLFEMASGGTLFLDEVADTSLAMQAKLLRVLQEGEIRRVGEVQSRTVDVRIVAAANRPLQPLVASGRFREDLFYRLHVLSLELPPLRERVEDIPALAEHLLSRMPTSRRPRVTRSALARLSAYAWPGNVRELNNELARASALCNESIGVADLSPHIARPQTTSPISVTSELLIRPRVEALERELVEEALRRTNGNQTQAAKLLGLSRYGLQKKLKRYGVSGSSS